MKNLTKKSFLEMVKKDCNYDEINFISCTCLGINWWVTIVRKNEYYLIYKSILNNIELADKINFIETKSALTKAIASAKLYI